MKIDLIPCLTDNYAALIHDSDTTILIDAPEAAPILAHLHQTKRRLTHILITHHHGDHVAGVAELKAKYSAKVYANKADSHRISDVDSFFEPNDVIKIGKLSFEVIDTPGHTVGHVVFHEAKKKLLFSGDTLFAGGCGRLFEGSFLQMFTALTLLKTLDKDTLIYCGHDYTLSNLRFAMSLEPNNQALQSRFLTTDEWQGRKPSVPFYLHEELATNPYFRTNSAEIRAKLNMETASDVAVFQEMRERKNRF